MSQHEQYLVVAVIETDDEELSNQATMTSYVERILMMAPHITRCRTLGKMDSHIISWGEGKNDKVFQGIPILEGE